MRQRQKRDTTILLRKSHLPRREVHIARQISMRQHHALRLSGCARRVDNRRKILWLEPSLAFHRNPASLCCLRLRAVHQRTANDSLHSQTRPHPSPPRAASSGKSPAAATILSYCSRDDSTATFAPGVPQHVSDLLRCQRRIERHIHPLQSLASQSPLPATPTGSRSENRHAIALTHAPSAETHPPAPAPDHKAASELIGFHVPIRLSCPIITAVLPRPVRHASQNIIVQRLQNQTSVSP